MHSDILRYNGGQSQGIFESSDLNLMGHQVIRVNKCEPVAILVCNHTWWRLIYIYAEQHGMNIICFIRGGIWTLSIHMKYADYKQDSIMSMVTLT